MIRSIEYITVFANPDRARPTNIRSAGTTNPVGASQSRQLASHRLREPGDRNLRNLATGPRAAAKRAEHATPISESCVHFRDPSRITPCDRGTSMSRACPSAGHSEVRFAEVKARRDERP